MSGIFNITGYGATGNGQTSDTAAIQAAVEACHAAGGGTVYAPPGKYKTGSIFLHSNITLHLSAGATLLGSSDPAEFPPAEGRWEGVNRLTHASLITGTRLNNVAVTGRGTIDGNGAGWWEKHWNNTLTYPRPRLISFFECTNVLIEGITAANSPSWTINPVYCENVTIEKVTILNPADSPNTDGINPDSCRNVHIANCHIDVGDDCVTIKSGTEEDHPHRLFPCENITITNCTMVHGHGGVVVGSEMSGDVRNVVVSNCVFKETDRGIRIKSRRGRGGLVEDVRVTNVVMENVLCPFIINLYYGCGAWGEERISDKNPYPVTPGTPRFRRIHFSHITARKVHYAAAFIYGLAEMPVEEITFNDISVSMAPEAQPGYPDMAPDMALMQRAGFFACNVRGIRFNQVEISAQLGPALQLQNVNGVEITACSTGTADPAAAFIQLEDVDRAFIFGCRAAPQTAAFIRLSGANTRRITLRHNDLAEAGQVADRAETVDPGALTLPA